ncbi:MAG: hypothetical protein Kow002_09160 [Anaerolineales bacterium]
MNKKDLRCLWLAITAIILSALACNVTIDTGANPTQPPTIPPAATQPPPVEMPPTQPQPPVEMPPTEPPATEESSSDGQIPAQIKADIDYYYSQDYLPFQNGELHHLEDFEQTKPAYHEFDFTNTRQKAQNFALWADIELATSGPAPKYPDFTGCGFAWRVQGNSDGYISFLANDYVRLGYCDSGLINCQLFGTVVGTGKVNVPNQHKARFSLAVNKTRATVLVDGSLVGRYDLFTSRMLGTGDLYYGVVSNINEGYWTSCKVSNVILWESLP